MRSPAVSEQAAATGWDLRALALAVVSWVAALMAFRLPGWVGPLALGVALGVLALRRRTGRETITGLGWCLAALGVLVSTSLQSQAVRPDPVDRLVRERASVEGVVVLRSDPMVREGRFGTQVLFRARLEQVTGRGRRAQVRAPVLLIADRSWTPTAMGSRVRLQGRLAPANGPDLAGVLHTRGPPVLLDRPGPLLRGADRLRAAIRAAADGPDRTAGALVPALVDGDDAALPSEVTEDFRTSGLTHLLAVSGTNLTIVVGCLLLLARWCRVRGRWLMLVGGLGVLGFVLLARAEPSVLRAAAMGTVALLGMGTGGRARGTRLLGVAVTVLLLFDPWLALSPGFALSTAATAGILLLAPGWRDRLQRWTPRWVAEAVSVPMAAQLACTPLVAALSGQVSLVAVAANLCAAPVVGPATVLGLAGGVVGLLSDTLGTAVARPAVWCARWIVEVAQRGADLPVASLAWPVGATSLALLTALCVLVAVALGRILARRALSLGCVVLMTLALLVPLPTPGWPPAGWVMVACDVGQGDALVLRAGPDAAVVVDAGPDPRSVDECLRRLGVRMVPLVVLTHFHADHVDGLPGVLRGRSVGQIEVTTLSDPLSGVRRVQAVAAGARVPVRRVEYGEQRSVGPLTWQVLAPSRAPSPDSESPPNDASIVLLVHTRGISLLLMGDEETSSQRQLQRNIGDLRVDVLKVAHHGSARQDPDLVRGLDARLAVISVGRDNDYGHPAPSLLQLLRKSRLTVARTDRDGDVAVVVDHGLRLGRRGGWAAG